MATATENLELTLLSGTDNFDTDTIMENFTKIDTAVGEADSSIGEKDNLTTTAKDNLVAAINEVDGNIGDLSGLTTTAKTNLVSALNEVNQNMVITGWYQPGANSISEAVSYAHNLLQNHQSINAIVRYSVDGSDNSLHIIGSKYSQTRGRYLVMNRTTDTVYSFRATDSGFEETEIQNIPTANHVDVTISGGDGSGNINISQYTGGYSAVIPVLINTTTGNWDINVGIQDNLLIAAGPGVAEGYQVMVRLYRFK